MKIEERYNNDAAFHRAVNLIYQLIDSETDLTPLDIRDACYLARLKYEQQHVRPITMDYNGYFERKMRGE